MKKQVLKKIGKALLSFAPLALIVVCSTTTSHAQVNVYYNGLFHVSSNSTFYIHTGTVTFGGANAPTTSKATPYAATDGKILLGTAATFSTDGTANKYVNGYAATLRTTETTLAIGAGSVYAPVNVLAATNPTGVQAAYFNTNPTATYAGLQSNVSNVATGGFWIVKGSNAILTLSWSPSSGVSSLNEANTTIVGYRDGKWEAINSAIDATSKFGGTSSITGSGSITTSSSINLANYSAFGIGEKEACGTLITASGNTRIWSGTAWDIAPTLADAVQLNGHYAGGSFACNSLNFNGFDVILNNQDELQVVNGFSGTGKVIMSSKASLIQRNTALPGPAIELTKTTRDLRRFDYVYWGQPVTGDVFSQLNNAQSGANPAGAFDLKYQYNAGSTATSGYGWQPLTATAAGRGFITRVAPQAPFVDASTSAPINLKFTGTANNGTVTATINKVPGNDLSARNNNLLANPYPSAIDAIEFLTANSATIDGVIYLWRANTSNNFTTYTTADYIAYTKAGSTALNGINTTGFDGRIASGQGFKVRAIADGTASFTNCMRVLGNNSQFFRTSNATNSNSASAVVDRFKLNVQTAEGTANQIVVAYLPETTLGYDNMYDARLLTVGTTNIYSILDNGTEKLAINARPTFQNTDQVSIGITKDAAITTLLTIGVADLEGIFANNQTPIYLHDAQLNVYHNFANGNYNFTTTNAEDTNRFKIVYQNGTLGQDDFVNAIVTGYIKNNQFNLSSSKEVASVQIYDITGRLVASFNGNDQKEVTGSFNNSTAIYISKILFTDGSATSLKLVNQ